MTFYKNLVLFVCLISTQKYQCISSKNSRNSIKGSFYSLVPNKSLKRLYYGIKTINFTINDITTKKWNVVNSQKVLDNESKRSQSDAGKRNKDEMQSSSKCDNNVCMNNGRCLKISSTGGYQCSCPSGYYGNKCEYDTPECIVRPCENGGKCVKSQSFQGFECICIRGFHGTLCQKKKRQLLLHGLRGRVPVASSLSKKPDRDHLKYVYTTMELIAILLTIFSLFICLVCVAESDRNVLEQRYYTMVAAQYFDVKLPRLEFFQVLFRRMKCILLKPCLMVPGCSGVFLTEDDHLLQYPFPTQSLIDLGKENLERSQRQL